MQRFQVSFGRRPTGSIRPIFQQQHALARSTSMLGFYSSCRKCKTLRLASTKSLNSHSVFNGGFSRYRSILSEKADYSLAKWRKQVTIQQACKSTTNIQVKETPSEEYHSPEIPTYVNQSEEEEFVKEETESNKQEGDENSVSPSKKKKNVKNPLPSTTVDGRQLTFVEETKVIAEVDALIKHNQASNAFQLFNRYRRMGHKFSVETYNQLLQGIANCGTWLQVDILLSSMASQAVTPNTQTYAYLIEACWRTGELDKLKYFAQKMEEEGMSKEHIFHESVLTKSQADAILSALKSIDSTYAPKAPPLPARTQMPDGRLFEKLKEPADEKIDSFLSEVSAEELCGMFEKQLENEMRGHVLLPSIEKKRDATDKELKRKALYVSITDEWRVALAKAVKAEVEGAPLGKLLKYSKGKTLKHKFIPYINMIEPEVLSDIVINEMLPMLASQPQGVSVNYICRYLGTLVHARYAMKCKTEGGVIDKVKEIYKDYLQYAVNNDELADVLPRVKWQSLEQQSSSLSSLRIDAPIWPYTVKVLVAGVLIDLFIKTALVDTSVFNATKPETIPALTHGYSSYEGRRFGILKMHPAVSRLYRSYLTNQGSIALEAEKVPMLVPPRPWTSTNQGGYLVHPVPFVRTIMDRYQLQELKDRDAEGKLNAVYDSLNFLGTTCWKINTKVLDIMISIFNDKGDRNLDIFGPDFPQLPKIKASKDMGEEERLAVMRERRSIKKSNHETFALRMDLLYKLSAANHLRSNFFWLPSNIDFRGRAYPIPPHGCHMGSDVARGMLFFGRGRPLGEDGLDWLKVHLVNLHGSLKKASLKERIDFATGKMEEILDSVDNPLEGRKWWQDGDEPWQCLAICVEIANAVRSPDPTKYVCFLPVHQDGSCNGLQHYSAMGLDEYGATQVNVKPCDRPQDLYGEVANLVEKKRATDASGGDKLAKQLEGKVNRKVVKQTVMTIVYGVTFVGGRLQIEKQLKELNVPEEILFKGSSYLVNQVFRSIGELFTSARKIQEWLTLAATQISLTGSCVDWVTPLGLPITQPYHKETTEEVQTPVQNVALTTMFDATKRPHLVKQKAGFAPNFVHSLDSCHMMLTSLFCQRAGLTFASVHDSYWSHPSTISVMNKICRQQFLSLHTEPILKDLQSHFQTKYGNQKMARPLKGHYKAISNFGNLPKPGSFDLTQVVSSIYFFS